MRAFSRAFLLSVSFIWLILFSTCIVYALPTASSMIGRLLEIIDILYPNRAISPMVQIMAMATVISGRNTPLSVLNEMARMRAITRT